MSPRMGRGTLGLLAGLCGTGACFQFPSKPEAGPIETAPGVAPDVDSVVLPEDSPAPAPETGLETGAPGDGDWIYPAWASVPPDPEWSPGDDVPGWEDEDCGYEEEAPYVFDLPAYTALDGGIGVWLRGEFEGRLLSVLSLQLETCTDAFPCDPEGDRIARDKPFVSAQARARNGSNRRLQGRYSSQRQDHWSSVVQSNTFGFDHSYRGDGKTIIVDLCLSRVRPDHIRGQIRTQSVTDAFAGPYDAIVLVTPFDEILPEHAASLYEVGTTESPPNAMNVYYIDPIDYLNVWPWEEITDPAIRSALFWKYLPYDWPFPVKYP